jgi:hypothetical protein
MHYKTDKPAAYLLPAYKTIKQPLILLNTIALFYFIRGMD